MTRNGTPWRRSFATSASRSRCASASIRRRSLGSFASPTAVEPLSLHSKRGHRRVFACILPVFDAEQPRDLRVLLAARPKSGVCFQGGTEPAAQVLTPIARHLGPAAVTKINAAVAATNAQVAQHQSRRRHEGCVVIAALTLAMAGIALAAQWSMAVGIQRRRAGPSASIRPRAVVVHRVVAYEPEQR